MRIFTIIAAFVCGIASASAADIGNIGQAVDKAAASGTPFAGGYLGAHAGVEFTAIELNDIADGIASHGLTGGIHGGFRWVVAPGMRAGVWAEGGISGVNTTLGNADLLMQDWYGAGGLDLCLVRSKTAFCGRGGYQFAQWGSDFTTSTADVRSWLLGASIETMISNNVSAGLTADYLILHNARFDGTDIEPLIRGTEGLRVLGRLTFQQ